MKVTGLENQLLGALLGTKDPRAIEPLIVALEDNRSEVRSTTAWVLGYMGDPRSSEALLNALKDENRHIVPIAFDALNKITGKYFGKNPEEWQSWWEKKKSILFKTMNMKNWTAKIARAALATLFPCLIWLAASTAYAEPNEWFLPISKADRKAWRGVQLTRIGLFGLKRKARPGIPAHLHTGTDIKRPNNNYHNEPVFAASAGKVISVRDDGPFAQVIIAHRTPDGSSVWTVYEHIAGIMVSPEDRVSPFEPIGRFMNKKELDKFGWQFNHVHFEVLKYPPRPLKRSPKTPDRLFGTYSLECYSDLELEKYYYDPIAFLDFQWKKP